MNDFSTRSWFLVLLLGTILAQVNSAGAEGTAAPSFKTAIALEAAVAFLSRRQQDDGSWKIDGDKFPAGVSSLCLLALLEGGVAAEDPGVQRGLKWLRERQPEGTYERALQTVVFCRAGAAEDAEQIARNVKWLTEAQVQDGEHKGGWSYAPRSGRPDGSCTRFAVWALDAARRANVKTPDDVWRASAEYWLTSQLEDGAWPYTAVFKRGTATMTLAGISCLSMVKDAVADKTLHTRIDEAVERAWQRQAAWHDTPQPEYLNADHFRYYAFQLLGQAAALSHRDKIGDIEWKPSATQLLLSQQDALTGGWVEDALGGRHPLIGASLAVLFLTEK